MSMDFRSNRISTNDWVSGIAEATAKAFWEHMRTGVPVDSRGALGNTLLHRATRKGAESSFIRDLLTVVCDVNATNHKGESALRTAASKGRDRIAALLPSSGADLNTKDNSEMTALMKASQNGHVKLVRVLLANGARPEETDTFGRTALTFAKDLGHAQVAKILEKYSRVRARGTLEREK